MVAGKKIQRKNKTPNRRHPRGALTEGDEGSR